MSLLRLRGKRKVGWGTVGLLVATWLLLALQPCAAAMAAAQSEPAPATEADCPHCLQPDAELPHSTAGCGDRLCQLENPGNAGVPEKPSAWSHQDKPSASLIWLLPPPLATLTFNHRPWSDVPMDQTLGDSPIHLLNCVFLN